MTTPIIAVVGGKAERTMTLTAKKIKAMIAACFFRICCRAIGFLVLGCRLSSSTSEISFNTKPNAEDRDGKIKTSIQDRSRLEAVNRPKRQARVVLGPYS